MDAGKAQTVRVARVVELRRAVVYELILKLVLYAAQRRRAFAGGGGSGDRANRRL